MIKITLKNSYEIFSCPLPTKDLALNTENRNDAIDSEHIKYGPLNLDDEKYWEDLADHWKTEASVAKKSLCGNCAAFDVSPQMKECMPGSVQEDGVLGYCWMHKFKCHSARTCYTWAAGGPIEDDDVSTEWAEKNEDQLDEKKKKQQKGKRRAAKTAKRKKRKQTKAKKGDRCTRIAKRKYDVWPSAYASGAVVRCRRGEIWKGLKEEEILTIVQEELEDIIDNNNFAEILNEDDSLDEKKQQKGKRRAAKTAKRKKKKAGSESSKESSLSDWFGRKGAPGKKGGWVDCNTCRKDKKTGRKKCKPCGRQKGEKRAKYPACRPTPGACGERGRGQSWGKKSKTKSEALQMHISEGVGVDRNFFRPGSDSFFAIIREARELYNEGEYTPVNEEERDILENFDLGEVVTIQGEKIPLDFPMLNEEVLDEKKDPPIGKPTKNTGSGKKYKVYVRNPKTGKIKKITYGDSKGGLKGNWNNAEARKSFAARHNCAEKSKNPNRRLTPGYWACRAHKDFGTNVPGRFW